MKSSHAAGVRRGSEAAKGGSGNVRGQTGVVPMLAGPVVMMFFRGRLKETLGTIDPAQALGVAGAVLALVSLGLIAAAIARFQRARLILD